MTASTAVIFEPRIALYWMALLAIGFSGLILLGVLNGQKSGLWRFGFLALLLAALANPQVIETERVRQRGTALILLDDSDSQSAANRLAALERSTQMLQAALSAKDGLDWKTARLSQQQPDNPSGTPLIAGLASALQDIPVNKRAGVVLVTDGQIDDVSRLETLDVGAPVHAIITGPRDLKDRRLMIEREPAFAEVGVTQSLTLTVDDIGYDTAEPARLEWQLNEKPVQSRLVTPGEQTTIVFTPSHRGQNVVSINVEARDGEVTTLNNRASFAVNGVRGRLRVVLVSGEPYQGERLWRSTLKSDPSVDLVHFTILRLPTSRDVTPVGELSLIPFPTQELFEKNLNKFDLVIFDRYSMRGVLQARYLANLADYVRQGGALLVAVGPEYGDQLSLYTTPLGDILPVAPRGEILDSRFRPEVTALGQRHPVTSGLRQVGDGENWGPWFRLSAGNVVSGQTVMTGPLDLPLLVLDRQGDGRVAMVMSDQSWVWGRGIGGGGPYAQFVRRLVHWLMREPDLEEEHLSARMTGTQLEIARRSLQNEAPDVTIVAPDGVRQSVSLAQTSPGIWSGSIAAAQRGLYRVSDEVGVALVAVGSDNRQEINALQPNDTALKNMVTGGVKWLEDGPLTARLIDEDIASGARTFGTNWLGLHDKTRGDIVSISQRSLLPAWAWLALLGSSLLIAWWREGR
ncbi:MAG: hypothetical protein AAF862_03415 [Pseudomonadota bacterium]